MKRYKAQIHFNKQRAAAGFPWTVHYRGACIPAKVVKIQVAMNTVYKPNKRSNPRAWVEVRAAVSISAGVVTLF